MLKQTEGSRAVAEAIALCRPEVICAYPITPQSETMQLVGATGGFIRRPFLVQAIFQAVIAGTIGMALLMTLFFALNNVLDIIQIELTIVQLALLFGAILVIGAFLTLISTWFALNKYLRTKLDDLY